MFLPNNHRMRMTCKTIAMLVLIASCGSKDSAPKVTTEKGPALVDPDEGKGPQPIETVREKMQQVDPNKPDYDDPNFKPVAKKPDDKGEKDDKKGDKQDSEWVPAENKKGASRWKDTGVYLDGKPVGFMQWAELPSTIPVVWFEDKVSANKRPGTNDPGYRIAKQRMYRFTDYLTAIGIDIKKIKELHVYGPKMTSTLIVTGKELQSEQAKGFFFRFGSNTGGKAIPTTPGAFGNRNVPDKISGVMVYINKQPPKLVPDVGMVVPGETEPNSGVPYFGQPLRGGIRLYVDDKLGGIIKRQDLDPTLAETDKDGVMHYKLAEVMKKMGIDTKKSVEVWVIRDERWNEKLDAAEVTKMTFTASSQQKGGILLGDKKVRAQALAFHSKPVDAKQIPTVTPDDE
jgi:hypothetical protein